jgi:hypothetical protein
MLRCAGALVLLGTVCIGAQEMPGDAAAPVPLQPFAVLARRVVTAIDGLGQPITAADRSALDRALASADEVAGLEGATAVLDRYALAIVEINPEARVKVRQGQAAPRLVEAGTRVFLVKVVNQAGLTAPLRVTSPESLPISVSSWKGNLTAEPARTISDKDIADRWADISLFDKAPLAPALSGLGIEYRVLEVFSRDAGKRAAEIKFDVGQGTEDLGYRSDIPIVFTATPARRLTIRVEDEKGRPGIARLLVRDPSGRVYPALSKRLAPDLPFQSQIYRADGEPLVLPDGPYDFTWSGGPDFVDGHRRIEVGEGRPDEISLKLERWIDTAARGWYAGDHHVHAAGCSHYQDPAQGVTPEDISRQVKGEGLNVGSVLTWGPCYYYQKQFFEAKDNRLSTGDNLMRYDLEVSGFPSSHCGHLVLLRLKDQDYPGAKVLEDWPTWDLPILQWAKRQGAVVGFAHSGWGLESKSDALPNYELPRFDGIGANEYIVDVTHDAVDFISTVDTPAPWELNIWYHTLNAGFRTRIGGETDFPCIYGERVGLGRSYVKLDGKLDYDSWTEGMREGASYVSDGKSHLIDFRVDNLPVGTRGSEVKLGGPGTVRVTARAAARLDERPNEAIGKAPYGQKPYWDLERARAKGSRDVAVELIVNGSPVDKKKIVADGAMRDIAFDARIDRSSWVALRILASSHTNPIFVVVGDKPIRASRRSAEWCLKAVDQCWGQKAPKISAKERDEAAKAYEHARQVYRRILAECEID